MRAGDKARQEYALDEAIGHYRVLLPLLEKRGESQAVALVRFKLALALHTSMRFAEANDTYQRAFAQWHPDAPAPTSMQTMRMASSFVPNDPDPRSAIAWPNIQLCMQLFDRLVEAWPERTIVPSLAESWEIADDGLRYVFQLREGLRWSDGTPLTAHDVEFGIKRVLDPERPGSSAAIYYVLENGQDYCLGRTSDASSVGVRALDDLTVEFRLAAPAPYFLSVMNRPDGGPQPRHAIERDGDDWTATGKQVVSGPFAIVERDEDGLVLERRADYANVFRCGNVERIEVVRSSIADAIPRYESDELDLVAVRYTPRLADRVMGAPADDTVIGPAAWTAYLAFDHKDPMVSNRDFRLALAHAIDRDELGEHLVENLLVATGGLVPPALQGHTPDIVPRYDPDKARALLAASGIDGTVRVAGLEAWADIIEVVARGWSEVLGLRVETPTWTPDQAWQTPRPWEEFIAPIVVTGWLPGYSRPGVLPAPAAAFRVEDERGRLRVRAVRRAGRAGAAGAARPRAARAVPRRRPDGRRRAGGADPDRVRPLDGDRQAARARLVGVRQDVGGVRRPRGRSALEVVCELDGDVEPARPLRRSPSLDAQVRGEAHALFAVGADDVDLDQVVGRPARRARRPRSEDPRTASRSGPGR